MLADWVKETVAGTPGSGVITLGGAVAGYCSFADNFGASTPVSYSIQDGTSREIGWGIYNAGTLTRTKTLKTLIAGVLDNTSFTPLALTSAATVSITASDLTTGKVVWSGIAPTYEVYNCNTAIPIDDTVPDITEGVLVATYIYTSLFPGSVLFIEGHANGTASAAGTIAAALFYDTGTFGAMAVDYQSAGIASSLSLNPAYRDNGDGTEHTYTLRVGASAGSFYVNGDASGGRLFGGRLSAYIKVTEIRI